MAGGLAFDQPEDELAVPVVGGAVVHRAELVDGEGPPPAPDALLAKHGRTGGVEPDRDRDRGEQGRQQHEQQRRADDVQGSAARVDQPAAAAGRGERQRADLEARRGDVLVDHRRGHS